MVIFAFLYGVATMKYEIFPYSLVKNADEAWQELVVEGHWKNELQISPTRHYGKYDVPGNGVTILKPDKIMPGYTLLVGFFDGHLSARLIDMDGKQVYQWVTSFYDIFGDPLHIPPQEWPKSDWETTIQGLILYPNGNIVVNFSQYGLAKLDRCGKILWTFNKRTHHRLFRDEEGNIWTGYYIERNQEHGFEDALPTSWGRFHKDFTGREDFIIKLSPEGKLLRQWSVPELILKNDLIGFLVPQGVQTKGDLNHLNDVEVLSSDLASKFPQFEAGDVLISLKRNSQLLVFDPETDKIKWYQQGPWLKQHDPDFTDKGTITVFSNNPFVYGGGNIIEIDPVSRQSKILYQGPPKKRINTRFMGHHQNLANGNILINSAEEGRAFEVTRDGEEVWGYVNTNKKGKTMQLYDLYRYPYDYLLVDQWSCH